jgi:arylsulfatase A-like enzyme
MRSHMSYSCLVVAGATMIVLGLTATASAADATKPNIVFLISDDHRWDALGVAGNDKIKTPHLDRMATEGQWYRNCTIQVSSCSPSRAALLTGLPPDRNGWYSNEFQRKDVIDAHGFDQYNLLPKEMIKNGYHTAFTGKWHLTPDPWLVGFQTVKRWMLGGAGNFLNPRLAEGYSREMKLIRGFTQTIFADDAIGELNKRASGDTTQPLFLWVAFTAPHGPFGPNPEPFQGMFADRTPEELAPETYYDDPTQTRRGRQTWSNYYEAMAALDHEVGRILDTIRESSLSTNTLVVFLGDNGFMMGRRMMHGKYVPYEDSLVVPLITWGPDSIMGTKGTTVTACVNSLDLPPTFVRLAGGTPPSDWTGRDATPVFKDGQTHDFTYAVSSYPDHDSLIDHVEAYRVIRTPEHKYIEWHPDAERGPEVYDLVKDPAENANLFGNPEAAEVQAKLKRLLDEYRARVGDNQWDMKGPLGMFEPERVNWTYNEGPQGRKQRTRPRTGLPETTATDRATSPTLR